MLEDPFDLVPGSVVERCRVVQRLGRGRFGTLYEARESPVGARVAVYIMKRSMLSRPDAASRFEAWARSLSSLRHPYLAELRSVGTRDALPYFISELPDAETLHVKLSRAGSLPLPLLVDVLLPVVSVIASSHRSGARQRATPYGVFLIAGDDGEVTPRMVGFAIAEALVGVAHDGPNAAPVELLPFLSPEEARGGKGEPVRSDLWSIGALLYAASTGRRPYAAATREATLAAMLTRAPLPPRELRPQLPVGFEALVMRAMERDPAARFASAEELGKALLPFASSGGRARWSAEFGAGPVSTTISEPPRHVPTRPPPAMPATPVSPRPSTPPTRDNRREHLRRVPLFSALPTADVENLLACVRWLALGAGDTLYRQGEAGETMAFVTEGTVAVYAERGDAQHELARLGVGTILGEMACLDPAPRSATVVAVEEVVVAELSRDGLDALTEHAPAIAAALVGEVIKHVAAKIREVEERIDGVLSPKEPSTPPAVIEAEEEEAPAKRDSVRPRGNSGVWRFVDFLKRIT